MKEKQTTKHEKPEIVCLCGSTRYTDEFDRQMLRFTLEGKIVLTIGTHRRSDAMLFANNKDDKKKFLNNLHKRKIDISDFIFVINKHGYIGEDTYDEIKYAKLQKKRIEFLEPLVEPEPQSYMKLRGDENDTK